MIGGGRRRYRQGCGRRGGIGHRCYRQGRGPKMQKFKGFLRKSAEFGKDTFYPTLKKLARTNY